MAPRLNVLTKHFKIEMAELSQIMIWKLNYDFEVVVFFSIQTDQSCVFEVIRLLICLTENAFKAMPEVLC
jgi:hypothetical protein